MQHKKNTRKQNNTKQHPVTDTLTGSIVIIKSGAGFFMHPTLAHDIRIEKSMLNTALNGDIVEIIKLPKVQRAQRAQGKVVRIVTRTQKEFVGTLKKEGDDWLLTSDNPRVYTPFIITKNTEKAKVGYKALVTLTSWNNPSTLPLATLKEVIGKAGEHETEMRAILLARGFASEFSSEVESEANALRSKREIPKEELQWREDFRTIPTFTIDPDDAKDFDDALSIRTLTNGNYEIGIHIADVTHYVRPDTTLDTEAQKRATSVYLVDRTIPMLPEVISNDLCSLNPNEEKRAFATLFEITPNAQVIAHRFTKTLISSDQRFTYKTAQAVLDNTPNKFSEQLKALWRISQKIRKERVENGAIEFDTNEIAFTLDENGVPISVHKKERLDTMKLIEEFMLLANRYVAKAIAKQCIGKNASQCMGIYRVHDAPDPDRLVELNIFLQALGYDTLNKDPASIEARDLAKLMRLVKGTPEEAVVQMATLRSMAKAVYTDKNIGHFSLGFTYYTHFTSPIRRYPDMMVHRILFAHISNTTISQEEIARYRTMAVEASAREVEAVRAERDSIKFKQVEYMQSRVGTLFEGKVTGVTKGGMFVAENETLAEGMVRMQAIPGDWFELDEKKYAVIGRKTGKKYRIGDAVHLRLIAAHTQSRELDWEVVV